MSEINVAQLRELAERVCGLSWKSRTGRTHEHHLCERKGRHTFHKCRCSAVKRNPHPDIHHLEVERSPAPDMRDLITAAVRKWESECARGYQWTAEDVIDFTECNIGNLSRTALPALLRELETRTKEIEDARTYILESAPDESREWTKDESLAEWIHHFGLDMEHAEELHQKAALETRDNQIEKLTKDVSMWHKFYREADARVETQGKDAAIKQAHITRLWDFLVENFGAKPDVTFADGPCEYAMKLLSAERERVIQLEAFLGRLATAGGAIVSSATLTTDEIAFYRACGRFFVDSNSLGYALLNEHWRKIGEAANRTRTVHATAAERDGVIEECAKECDYFAASLNPDIRHIAESCARYIRALTKPSAPVSDGWIPKMQERVRVWATKCFGEEQMTDPKVRALRLAEEAIEFAQAVGADPEKLHNLVGYVYARPAGNPPQELGGVAVTALAAAASVGVQFSDVLLAEVERVEAKSPEHFAKRNQVKVDAGFGPSAPVSTQVKEESDD